MSLVIAYYSILRAVGDNAQSNTQGDLYEIHTAIFDPRHLGLGAARPRFWAILTRKETTSWLTRVSLGDLLKEFFVSPVLNAS